MKIVTVLLVLAASLKATDAKDILHRYLWENRIVIIFSPSLDVPLLKEQQRLIEENKEGIVERDIVTILVTPSVVSVDAQILPGASAQSFYERFKVNQNLFSVILLGKDGGQKLRKNRTTMSRDELFPLIDAMPMRRREIRQRNQS